MTKTTTTYLGFLLVFGLGLWTILSFGAIYCHAPTDVSGEWKSEFGVTTHIEQSGDFVEVSLIDGRTISLVLQSETRDRVGRTTMQLTGGGWKANFHQQSARDVFRFSLVGPDTIDVMARRTTPLAAKDLAAKTKGH